MCCLRLGCIASGFDTSYPSSLDFQTERKFSLTAGREKANHIFVKAKQNILLLYILIGFLINKINVSSACLPSYGPQYMYFFNHPYKF